MKKLILLKVMMIGFAISGFAKYYIGVATTTVNLREGPSIYFDVLCQVPKGGYVFVDTEDTLLGFYRVVYVDKDEVGYISSKYVKLLEEVKVDRNGVLQVSGESKSYYNSEVEINNASSHTATIRIGGQYYKFKPWETRKITLSPGTYTIQASAPGVLPYIGSDKLEGGYIYSWKFYVRTTRY